MHLIYTALTNKTYWKLHKYAIKMQFYTVMNCITVNSTSRQCWIPKRRVVCLDNNLEVLTTEKQELHIEMIVQ